jgi:hypothetical protein
MQNSPEILNELMAVSPLIAGLDKVNVFKVPEGYFNELHLRITDFTIINNTSSPDNTNATNLQQVPEGYFDSLSDSILAKVKIAYSENTEIERDSALLQSLKGINVFTIPNGYFDALTDSVLSKTKTSHAEKAEEELRDISPMLYSIKGENVFTVPNGYFESFADEIIEKIKPQPAKVITMKKRTSWFKYAAAAVVAGIISVTSLQIFNNSHNSDVSSLPADVQISFKYKTQDDINNGIAKLSDDDIAKYLEKNGNALDNELLTNNADVSEMPGTTDYLNDANTLNNYLDKIDAENVGKLTP